MGESQTRVAPPDLLHYRPSHGQLRATAAGLWPSPPGASLPRLALAGLGVVPGAFLAAWPIARASLVTMFRRWFFWVLYALALLIFLFFFFGQYLMAWAQTQLGESDVRLGGLGRINPRTFVLTFRAGLGLDGSGDTFRNFIAFEGYPVMVVLALAGSILIGNDLRFDSLPFYLSKPLSRWHYVLGKGLAVAVFINMLTTLPALCLFVQYGLLDDWSYFSDNAYLALGILGYGTVLTLTLTLVLLATATALRRTVPLIMTWTTLFLFCRLLSVALVDRLRFDAHWRLIDLWNSMLVLGHGALGLDPAKLRPAPQPEWYEAALVLGGVCLSCLIYLVMRIRAVEIIR